MTEKVIHNSYPHNMYHLFTPIPPAKSYPQVMNIPQLATCGELCDNWYRRWEKEGANEN